MRGSFESMTPSTGSTVASLRAARTSSVLAIVFARAVERPLRMESGCKGGWADVASAAAGVTSLVAGLVAADGGTTGAGFSLGLGVATIFGVVLFGRGMSAGAEK